MYELVDKETGNWCLGVYPTREQAQKELEQQELDDIETGQYQPDFYEIKEAQNVHDI